MTNAVERLNPNKEVLALKKRYGGVLRRNGYTPAQEMCFYRMVVEMQREDEFCYCQKLPIAIFGLFINVLAGNKYTSKKRIEQIMEEVIELYKEIDLSLLDVDDVLGYCEKEVGMKITLERKELVEGEKPSFKISGMKTHQERTAEVLKQAEEELKGYLEKDSEDYEAEAQLRLLNKLKGKFEKEGILWAK